MARTVNRRAQLQLAQLPTSLAAHTLQHYLEQATLGLDLDSTEFASAQFGALRLNQTPVRTPNGSLRLKIVGHAPEEHATTVPKKVAGAAALESAAAPPFDHSFKTGDFFLVVRGNQLLGIGDHMRFETAIKYIRELLIKSLGNTAHAATAVSTVFRFEAAAQLRSEGVKAIEFEARLSAAAIDKVEEEAPKSAVRRLLDGLVEEAKSVIAGDVDPAALADVRVAVAVDVSGGIHGAAEAQNFVDKAAHSLLASDVEVEKDVAATIVTKKGNRVSLGSATLGETYKLSRRANESSLIDNEVWDCLSNFESYVISLGELRA